MAFLTAEPLWLSGTLLLGVATLLAMASPVLVRRRVSLDRLRVNNEVAGFKFATVGVLYAVLLAFAVIVVWRSSARRKTQWPKRLVLPRRCTDWPMGSGASPAPRSGMA